MFRLKITDAVGLHQIINLNKNEYLDVFLEKNQTIIINNSQQKFGMYTLECNATMTESAKTLRIPRKLFSDLVEEGYLDVEVNAETTTLTFRDTTTQVLYSFDIITQDVFSSEYQEKIAIAKLDEREKFSSQELENLIRIGSSNNGIISVKQGIACTNLSGNSMVFQNVSIKDTFSVLAQSLKCLKSCSNTFFNVRDYIGACNKNMTILITKARELNVEQFEVIKTAGAKMKCKFNFNSIIKFFSKTKLKVDTLKILIKEKICIVETMNKVFRIPIGISDLQFAPGVKETELILPFSVLNDVIFLLPLQEFEFSFKKNFMQLNYNSELIIAF